MFVSVSNARFTTEVRYDSGYITVDAAFSDAEGEPAFVTVPVAVSANASAIDVKAAVSKVAATILMARETYKRVNGAKPMTFDFP